MPKAASEILAPSAHASPPLLQAWLFQDVRSMPPPASGPHALLGALAWAGGLLRILAIAYSAKRPAAANQAGAAASSQSSALATSLTCRDAGSPARPSRRAPDACARRANSGPAGTCRSSSRSPSEALATVPATAADRIPPACGRTASGSRRFATPSLLLLWLTQAGQGRFCTLLHTEKHLDEDDHFDRQALALFTGCVSLIGKSQQASYGRAASEVAPPHKPDVE